MRKWIDVDRRRVVKVWWPIFGCFLTSGISMSSYFCRMKDFLTIFLKTGSGSMVEKVNNI